METIPRKVRLPAIRMVKRPILLAVWIILVVATLGIKAISMGWFAHRQPLVLNGQPALLFFTISRGCDCQMMVVHNAEAQLTAWQLPANLGLSVIRLDFNRRLDLAKQYRVARAPALVLLDTARRVIWKQDEGLSDEAPLDLIQAQSHIEVLISDDTK